MNYQSTLTDEKAKRRECEYSDVCTNPAINEVKPLRYDKKWGWMKREIAACEVCTDEYKEPGTRTGEIDVRRLKPAERWTT